MQWISRHVHDEFMRLKMWTTDRGNLLLVPHAGAGVGERLCRGQIGQFSFSLCAAEKKEMTVKTASVKNTKTD